MKPIEEIQNKRKQLRNLIVEEIIPLRKELDDLLNKEAQRLCPFNINDKITLENGKQGIIESIEYHTLDYAFGYDTNFEALLQQIPDDIDYIFAYEVDDKEFSLTWKLSGHRMIKKNTEIGKIPFSEISPDQYDIDIKNKKVNKKRFSQLIADESLFSTISDVK